MSTEPFPNLFRYQKLNQNGRNWGYLIRSSIPEEIFALFFVLVILSLAKDEDVVEKVQKNVFIQIAVGIMVIFCIYNRMPWSLVFLLGFVMLMSFKKHPLDSYIDDMKKFFERKENGKKDSEHDDQTMKLGARVIHIAKGTTHEKREPQGILKKKKVSFSDLPEEKMDSGTRKFLPEQKDKEDICLKVSRMFGFDDSDTEGDLTDTEDMKSMDSFAEDEGENEVMEKKKDLENFLSSQNTEGTI
jgi:hypothetical protein